jgi:hypothetical protein
MQTFVKRSLVAGVSVLALGAVALRFARAADMEVPKEDFQGYAQGDEQGTPPPAPGKYQGRPYLEEAQPPEGYGPPEQEGYAYVSPPQAYGYAPPVIAYAYPAPRYVVGPVFAPPYYVRGPYWHGYGPHFAYGYGHGGFGHWGHGWRR